jgi:hypothetical protein
MRRQREPAHLAINLIGVTIGDDLGVMASLRRFFLMPSSNARTAPL